MNVLGFPERDRLHVLKASEGPRRPSALDGASLHWHMLGIIMDSPDIGMPISINPMVETIGQSQPLGLLYRSVMPACTPYRQMSLLSLPDLEQTGRGRLFEWVPGPIIFCVINFFERQGFNGFFLGEKYKGKIPSANARLIRGVINPGFFLFFLGLPCPGQSTWTELKLHSPLAHLFRCNLQSTTILYDPILAVATSSLYLILLPFLILLPPVVVVDREPGASRWLQPSR